MASAHSTLSMSNAFLSKYRKDSVDFGPDQDIERLKSSGISFETILKIIFEIGDNKPGSMKDSMTSWILDAKDQRLANANANEKKMYHPFIEVGNCIIQKALEEISSGNDATLLNNEEWLVERFTASCKPDAVVIPNHDSGLSKNLIRADTDWPHVLLWPEFKVVKNNRGTGGRMGGYGGGDNDDCEDEGSDQAHPIKVQKSANSPVHSSSDKTRKAIEMGSDVSSIHTLAYLKSDYETQVGCYAVEILSIRSDQAYVLRLMKGDIPLAALHALSLSAMAALVRPGLGVNNARRLVNSFTAFATTISVTHELTQLDNPTRLPFYLVVDLAGNDICPTLHAHTHHSLLGHGTIVRNVYLPGYQNSSSNIEMLFKSILRVTTRNNECSLIAEARQAGPEHVVHPHAYAVIGDIFPSYQLLNGYSGLPPKNVLRIPIERTYVSISAIQDPQVFWNVLIQCTRCAHRLYSQINYLHRDISTSNLGYHVDMKTGKYIGVIFDLDILSLESPQEFSAHVRTSTAPFMAREVLDVDIACIHKFQHELESLLCVAIWHALGYDRKAPPKDHDFLKKWRRGPCEDIKLAKDAFFSVSFESFLKIDDTKPRHNFLRKRCFSLVAYFDSIDSNAKFARRHIGQFNPLAQFVQADEMATKITYPRWLHFAGDAIQPEEKCTNECCVQSASNLHKL